MKKKYFLFLLLFALLLTGCQEGQIPEHQESPEEERVEETMPSLLLEFGGKSLEIPPYSYTWTYQDEKGQSHSVVVDVMHPTDPQAKEFLPLLHGEDVKGPIFLKFSPGPQEIKGVCYLKGNDTSSWESKDLDIQDKSFSLQEGALIYEITATWTQESQENYGSVSYCFRVEE